MAKLTKDEVKKVAELAKINLTSGEVEKFQEQLSKVISYIEELKEVDTTSVIPTSQTTGLVNVYREDQIDSTVCLDSESALSGAAKKHNGYFVVDAVLTK